jgi:hypothetical protein
VLGDVRVLEEDEMVVRRGRGDGVPDDLEGVLEVLRLDRHLEDPDLIRFADLGAFRQRCGELLARLTVARCAEVQHEQVDAMAHPEQSTPPPAERKLDTTAAIR